MPDSFAALPVWAIIAIFALIGGAAGASGAFFLRRSFPAAAILRFLPLLTLAAGAALGTLLALPTIRAESIPLTCEGAEEIAADANATAPGTKVDDVTTIIDMEVDCSRMTIAFRHSVALAATDIADDVWANAVTTVTNGRCGSPLWRRYVAAGWTLVNDYTFEDGGNRAIAVDACG